MPLLDSIQRYFDGWNNHDVEAILASLTENVCPYDPCPVVSESTLMWRNESHLTATFAQQLWPAMRDIVRDALPAGDEAEAS